MKMVQSNIEINTSCEKIWNILMDFERYPEWNPFIKEIKGKPVEGSKISVTIQAPGLKPRTFRPAVHISWEKWQLRWLGRLGIPGLFDGEHMFILEELDPEVTRFHQNEVFRGILVSRMERVMDQTRAGFELMNSALKKRAETG